jgi:nitrous oxidase accessory protein NosD
VRCGRGGGTQNGTSGIAVKIDAPDTSVPGLHKRLLIEGNIIEGEDAERCILVSQAADAVVRYNELSGCKQPVAVEHSTGVQVYANTAAR